jgi:hypothetical protein
MAPDPWTAFLEWLTTVLVPAWSELIALLPYVIIGGLVGPILTIIVLMWAWYLLHRQRGRVHRSEQQPVAAPRGADGLAAFPVNVPYCEQHGLVFPPRATACTVDGAALSVTCPVDGTVRDAEIATCAGCGTTFKLGAATGPLTVVAPEGPPEGGRAIA